jgi:hypothetical protein
MNPMLRTFLRLTVLIAAVLVGLWLLAAVFHFVIIAAILAAVAMGGLFLYNAIRRRSGVPVIRR